MTHTIYAIIARDSADEGNAKGLFFNWNKTIRVATFILLVRLLFLPAVACFLDRVYLHLPPPFFARSQICSFFFGS